MEKLKCGSCCWFSNVQISVCWRDGISEPCDPEEEACNLYEKDKAEPFDIRQSHSFNGNSR